MAHCPRCGRVPPSPPLWDPLIEEEDGEREGEEDGGADEAERRLGALVEVRVEEGVVQEGRGS